MMKDPADVLLDTEAIAERYGIKIDTARKLVSRPDFPGFDVSERRHLAPLAALRRWELIVALSDTIAAIEPERPSVTVLAPPAHGTPGRRPNQKAVA